MYYLCSFFIFVVSSCCGNPPKGPSNLIIRELQPEFVSGFPPPPHCQKSSNQFLSQNTTTLKFYSLDDTIPVAQGFIWWYVHLITSCTVWFFGEESHEILSETVIPCPQNCSSIPLVSSATMDIQDLSPEPAFLCQWTGTQQITSVRLKVQRVTIYTSSRGGIWAQGKSWTSTSQKHIFKNQNYHLGVDDLHLTANCPVKLERTSIGVMTRKEGGIQEFFELASHRLFSVRSSPLSTLCYLDNQAIIRSSLGYLISWQQDSLVNLKNPEVLSYLLKQTYSDPGSFASQINYDVVTIRDHFNKHLHQAQITYCKIRELHWSRLQQIHNSDDMAHYITGDLYAFGRIQGSKIHIRSSIPYTIHTVNVSFSLSPRGFIIVKTISNRWKIEPVSGILNPPRNRYAGGPFVILINESHYYEITSDQYIPLWESQIDPPLNFSTLYQDSYESDVPHDNNGPGPTHTYKILRRSIVTPIIEWWESLSRTIHTIVTVLMLSIVLFMLWKFWKCLRLSASSPSISRFSSPPSGRTLINSRKQDNLLMSGLSPEAVLITTP